MQAMPQLTDRSKLPNIVDPVIKNTMDLKHLFQVCELHFSKHNSIINVYNLDRIKLTADKERYWHVVFSS